MRGRDRERRGRGRRGCPDADAHSRPDADAQPHPAARPERGADPDTAAHPGSHPGPDPRADTGSDTAVDPDPTPAPTPVPTPTPPPVPAPTIDFTAPDEGTVSTVTAGTTVATAWSESVASGRTVAGRSVVMEEAPASSATACAAIGSFWTNTALAASGPGLALGVGGGGRCLRLRVTVTDSGAASGTATSGRLFVFGPGSVRVNAGATATRSRSVSLAITVPTGAGWMRIANSSAGLDTATSRSPGASAAWTLTSGDGSKRVYVRFGGGSLATPLAYGDGIVLDTRAPTVRVSGMTVSARFSDGSRTVRIVLSASGTGSALTGIRVTTRTTLPAVTRAWSNPLSVRTKATTLYLRVRDAAGNWSGWISFHPPR